MLLQEFSSEDHVWGASILSKAALWFWNYLLTFDIVNYPGIDQESENFTDVCLQAYSSVIFAESRISFLGIEQRVSYNNESGISQISQILTRIL